MTLRGPEGIRSRMDQLSSRLGAAPEPPSTAPFARALEGKLGSAEALAPMSPFAPGMGLNGAVGPVDVEAIKTKARQTASRFGLQPELFEALIGQESGFNPLARSSKGAMGLGQLMPGTARELGVADPYNIDQNLEGSASYLAKMMERFGGNVELALAAYNAGPGRVANAGGIPNIRETQEYVRHILERTQRGISP